MGVISRRKIFKKTVDAALSAFSSPVGVGRCRYAQQPPPKTVNPNSAPSNLKITDMRA